MHHKYTLLSLGDSYTIGEAVEEHERFPNQVVALLKEKHINFEAPVIIAKTGWTTDELDAAITERKLHQKFDFVTLLIGVNNQYRGRDIDNYRKEFRSLLQRAIGYAGNNPGHVIVIAIPDWGVTPFALNDKRGEVQIGKEIDAFNAVSLQEATQAKVIYVDINPGSKKAKTNSSLLANDGLHPSGLMYAEWAKLVAGIIAEQVR